MLFYMIVLVSDPLLPRSSWFTIVSVHDRLGPGSSRLTIVSVHELFQQLLKNLFYDLADAEQIFVNYNVQQPVDTDI